MTSRRVVVTGLGLVTPLGTGVSRTWQNLINSQCGIVSLTQNDTNSASASEYAKLPTQIAAKVPAGSHSDGGFQPTDWLDRGDDRVMAKFTQYAIAAAKQALNDAEWHPTMEKDQDNTGVCIGSGMGSLDDLVSTTEAFTEAGYRKVSPMFVPKILINMAAGHLTMKYGFKGPNHAVSTACTTGAHSIGDAMRFIQSGDADVMVAGGSEACIHPLAIAGFCKAKSLATAYNDDPKAASRPFDKDRSGFVMGEGAGIMVLEELEHARERGAKIYAEIKGYGLSGDAHHMTAPPEDGSGAAKAMRRALAKACIAASDIDYVNAHATSTPLGDAAENRAIKSVFETSLDRLAVSSTKGAIGHLLGAAGAVEAIFTVLALHHGVLPPTLNLHSPGTPAEDFNLNYVPLVAQERGKHHHRPLRHAITNSFGFGGTNASLVFAKI